MTLETPARLVVDPIEPTKIADLYLPKERWLEIVRLIGGSNRLTVVLRFEEGIEINCKECVETYGEALCDKTGHCPFKNVPITKEVK